MLARGFKASDKERKGFRSPGLKVGDSNSGCGYMWSLGLNRFTDDVYRFCSGYIGQSCGATATRALIILVPYVFLGLRILRAR